MLIKSFLLGPVFLAGMCVASLMGVAQEPATAAPEQTQPAAAAQKPSDQDAATGTNSEKSNDRIFFALPNYLTVEAGQAPLLSPQQKFSIVARSAFDYVQVPWYMSIAAVNQAENSEPGYGQGWKGYAKRFGASFADGTIENFMVGAVFPSVLHQDPRFYQSNKGGFARRTGYAVSRIFVTRSDSGRTEFNFSEIFGSAAAAAISTNTYHPRSTFIRTPAGLRYIPSDRTLTNTASVWASEVGTDTLTILIKEFWPDIHRKMSHKRPDAAAAPDASKP